MEYRYFKADMDYIYSLKNYNINSIEVLMDPKIVTNKKISRKYHSKKELNYPVLSNLKHIIIKYSMCIHYTNIIYYLEDPNIWAVAPFISITNKNNFIVFTETFERIYLNFNVHTPNDYVILRIEIDPSQKMKLNYISIEINKI